MFDFRVCGINEDFFLVYLKLLFLWMKKYLTISSLFLLVFNEQWLKKNFFNSISFHNDEVNYIYLSKFLRFSILVLYKI